MTANPYAVAGGAVAVTATSTGQLTPPAPAGQGGYNFATVSNASPWLCTVVGAAGTSTLQPFTADVIPVSLGQLLSYTMSIPPGGSGTTVSAQPTYIQADWFAAGNAPPVGTYPISLTAQAILASVSGPVIAVSQDTGNLVITGMPVSYFGPKTDTIVKWAMISIAIASATVSVPGVLAIYLGGAVSPLNLPLYVPFEPTFVPVAETVTITFPTGGVSVAANAAGVFSLDGVLLSGTMSAIVGNVIGVMGY
jgi:hypothetical protein